MRLATALSLILLAPPALALTPDELWARWQDQAAAFGLTLTATATPEGDGLALTALALSDGGPVAATPPPGTPLDRVTLTPAGDGAVAIGLALPATSRFAVPDSPGSEVQVDQRGLTILARPDGGRVIYALAAEALRVGAFAAPSEPFPVTFGLEAQGLALSLPDAPDAAGAFPVALSAAGLAYLLDMGDPLSFAQTQTSRTDGLAMTMTLAVPPGTGLADLEALGAPVPAGTDALLRLIEGGLGLSLQASAGDSDQTDRLQSAFLSYDYRVRSGPSTTSLRLSGEGLAWSLAGEGGTIAGSTPLLPVGEVGVTVGPVALDLRVPFTPRDTAWGLRLSLGDTVLDEAAWSAFDPGALLPREPLRAEIDLGGEMAFDLARTIRAEAAGRTAPPPDIRGLDIRAWDIAFAGGRIQATGSLTFDDAMNPAGSGELTLAGSSRLLDAGVALGLLSDQDARGARLALASFFDPAPGAPGGDVLVTRWEVGPGNRLRLNGIDVPLQ